MNAPNMHSPFGSVLVNNTSLCQSAVLCWAESVQRVYQSYFEQLIAPHLEMFLMREAGLKQNNKLACPS